MSGVSAVQRGEVHSAIARASAATGVDFNYLLAQAKLESGLDSSARAGTSSAAGLYQFIGGTWLETLDRHGSTHGLAWADSLISRSGGRATIHDPAARAQVMALRFDPNVSALMAAELARDNSTELSSFLGREPEDVVAALAEHGSIGAAIDALDGSPRRLRPIRTSEPGFIERFVASRALGDPLRTDDAWRPWVRRAHIRRDIRRLLPRVQLPPEP